MKDERFKDRIKNHLSSIYHNVLERNEIQNISKKIDNIFKNSKKNNKIELWDEKDFFLITYADSIKNKKKKNLQTLNKFLNLFCKEFKFIHILPFFPYSSDDGFAVKDYKTINSEHGNWEDFKLIASSFNVMIDLVINHCSSKNTLFKNFIYNENPGADYFISNNKKFKISSKIVRPRSSDLSKKVLINGKIKYVWCTFSHDQVDFNFKNPDVLIYFLEIIKFYLEKKSKALRLDAVAFLWKQIGTRCINLPQTHEIVRLIRTILEKYYGNILLITETNIPSNENLSYFGNNNEAHCIYNFTLAPLLIHSLISGNSIYLKQWSRSMPPAQERNAYLNFLSTHDGIGLRPVEGILPDTELLKYIDFLKKQGGLLTYRDSQGKKTVYEVNITLFNALKNTYAGNDSYSLERFTLAHTILFSLEGIPAVYILNLFGTENDYKKVKVTNVNRSINRTNWDYEKLAKKLNNKLSKNFQIYNKLKKIMILRKKQPAFHPNATQFTLQLKDCFFGLWRQSIDRSQSIFCISNLTNEEKQLPLLEINLISTNNWFDILTKKKIVKIDDHLVFKPYQTFWITNKSF